MLPLELHWVMGYSVLRYWEVLANCARTQSKGNEVNIPQVERGYCVAT